MVLLWIATALVLLSALAGAWVFKSGVCRPNIKGELPMGHAMKRFEAEIRAGEEWFDTQPWEEAEIHAPDGIKLRGRFLPAAESKGTLLMMHGFQGSGRRDFAGISRRVHELGYNMLVPDQRAHWRSEGRYICFGVKERYDCLEWIRWLNAEIGEETDIFLQGMSMGSTTVLMTAGLELPENVRGIIADCGFTSPWEIMKYVVKTRLRLPPFPLMWFVWLYARVFAGYSLSGYSTLDAMKRCRMPVLLIHGEDDKFVPHEMSERNYAACAAEKTLIVVPGARHGLSYLVDKPRCDGELLHFLEKHGRKE